MKTFISISISLIVGFFCGWATMLNTTKIATDDAAKFSDVIRCYSDNNPNSNILDYLSTFDTDSTTLAAYVYAY